jgi:16S rRNA processing protein RimM
MPLAFAELVAIGRVVKPQGRKGEVLTEPLSDRPDRFPSLKRAFVPGPGGEAREVKITASWPHKGRFVLKLAGVDSIDAAEAFRGQELRIPEADLAKLPEGSYYHHELIGLAVFEPGGRPRGRVKDVLETGAGAPVLVIAGGSEVSSGRGLEYLVPLAEDFVTRVDVKGGRLTIAFEDWGDAVAN